MTAAGPGAGAVFRTSVPYESLDLSGLADLPAEASSEPLFLAGEVMDAVVDRWCHRTVAGMGLRSDTFDIEPEITAKLFKRNRKVFEIPITYNGRTYAEGKKIGPLDALRALRALFRFRFTD